MSLRGMLNDVTFLLMLNLSHGMGFILHTLAISRCVVLLNGFLNY